MIWLISSRILVYKGVVIVYGIGILKVTRTHDVPASTIMNYVFAPPPEPMH